MQFCQMIGQPYYSVFRYFRKGYDPKISTVDKWTKALGVKLIKET